MSLKKLSQDPGAGNTSFIPALEREAGGSLEFEDSWAVKETLNICLSDFYQRFVHQKT